MTSIDLKKKTIFVTGAAGFIGYNLVLEMLKTQSPITVIGIDNMNDYYDVSIKEWRLCEIQKCAEEHADSTWTFIKVVLCQEKVQIKYALLVLNYPAKASALLSNAA